MKLLISQGADATWVPNQKGDSAAFVFFRVISLLLLKGNDLPHSLLPLFLTEKCLNHRVNGETILMGLINGYWQRLHKSLPDNFAGNLKVVAKKIIEADPGLLDLDVSEIEQIMPLECLNFFNYIAKTFSEIKNE